MIVLVNSYANRTKSASEGADWKALSHAVRVMDEVYELLTDHHITFPLREAKYIKQIKKGLVPLNSVITYLEKHIQLIDQLIQESTLPDTIDQRAVDSLLKSIYL